MSSIHALVLLSTCLLAGAGCAFREAPPPVTDADGYLPAASAALAYDPPLYLALDAGEADQLDAQLARYERGPAALLGYDTPTVSTYWRRVDDRQYLLGSGSYGYGGFGRGHRGYGWGGAATGRSGIFDLYLRREVSTSDFTRVRPAGQ